MKAITKFVANDGSEHLTESAARERELLCAEVAEIVGLLLPRPEASGCDFENGRMGYIQQDPATVSRVRLSLLKLAQRFSDFRWLQEAIDGGDKVHPSYPGRIIDECCPRPVSQAWYRFMCIDNDAREWGQPYYRDHPKDARDHRINS